MPIEEVLMGMASQLSEREDALLCSDVRDNLFGPMEFSRRDLGALNIMRGRDNGLPDYNTARYVLIDKYYAELIVLVSVRFIKWITCNGLKYRFMAHGMDTILNLNFDDLQIYTQIDVNDIEVGINNINNNLNNIHTWSRKYGLSVNPAKCQAIIIGSSRQLSKCDLSHLSPIILNNTVIPFSPVVKNLGVYMDSTLNWSAHVNEVCRSVFATLHSLNRLKNFLPVSTKK